MLARLVPSVALNPNFQKLWWAQVLASSAFNTLTYTLIIRIAERTGGNTPVSLFVLSFSVPALIFGLLAGVWVDRIDRRLVLIVTNLSRAALIPAFYFAESWNFVLIYPLAIVTSLITQLFIPAEATRLAATVSKEDLHQANSLFTFTLYASFIIGPIAAGPALKYFGLGKVSIALFILFTVAGILTWLLPSDEEEDAKVNWDTSFKGLKGELLDAFRYILGNNLVFGGLALLTFSQALVSTIVAVAPGYARSVLGIEVADTSTQLLAPAAFGMILVALLLSRFGNLIPAKLQVTVGVFLAGVGLIALGGVHLFDSWVDPLVLSAGLLFMLGSVNALIIVPSQTAVQRYTPEELRGRIFGILATMINAASFLPVLFAGVVADTFGVVVMMVLLGLSVFMAGFYVLDKATAGVPVRVE
jgi:MFS family permease